MTCRTDVVNFCGWKTEVHGGAELGIRYLFMLSAFYWAGVRQAGYVGGQATQSQGILFVQ